MTWNNVQDHPAGRYVEVKRPLVHACPEKVVLLEVLADERLHQRLLLEEGLEQDSQLAGTVHPRWVSLLQTHREGAC